MRVIALTCLLLVGCRGETVVDDSADAQPEASIDAAADTAMSPPIDTALDAPIDGADGASGCPSGTMNLVLNSSFDLWSGTLPDGYSANAAVTVAPMTGDAGESAARLTWSSVGYGLYQRVTLPVPLPPGCRLRVRGRARYVSGAVAAPSLILTIEDAAGGATDRGSAFAWAIDGTWKEHSVAITSDRLAVRATAFFVGNTTTPQTVDLDDLELTFLP